MKLYSLLLMLPQEVAADDGLVNMLVQRFNEGGEFMWPVLVSLIIGLAIAFERMAGRFVNSAASVCPPARHAGELIDDLRMGR